MKFELSEKQIQSLSAFLGRLDLKGTEVQAFNELIAAFAKPLVEEIKTTEEIK